MSARKIRGHWYVDFRHEYQRVRKRSPENSRAGALAYEATLRGRLARGQPMIPAPRQPTAKPRFEAFAWRWYAIYVETNNKPSEQKAKRLILKNHLVPAFGTLTLDAITTLKAEEFKAVKLTTGLAPKSINNCLAVLGKCLRTAEEWNELDRVPKLKLLRVPPQKFDFLSREEAERLIRTTQEQPWRAMITVALRTGLRLGELIALDWSDVNVETRLLTVRRSAFKRQIVSTKSNRIRHIPFTKETERALRAIQQPSGAVFNQCGRSVDDQSARRAIARLSKEAGIRHIGWHVLRHTFASHLVTAGVSIKAVQELLGHSDVRTTMRYAHLAPSALHDAVRVLEPTVALDDILGQPVGTALGIAERHKTETPQFMGRF
jgi:integrase